MSVLSPQIGFLDFTDDGWKDLDKKFSLCLWSKFNDEVPGANSMPVNWVKTTDTNMFQPFAGNTGYFWSNAFEYSLPEEYEINVWHHWCVVVDSANVTLYLDGVLLDEPSFDVDGSMVQPESTFIVGAHLYTRITKKNTGRPIYSFRGGLDDLTLWSRTITAEEVVTSMKSSIDIQKTIPSDIVLYYNFDVIGCDTSAATEKLLWESCPMLGEDKKLVKNWGSAGSKYDMLMGMLNNDYGFGKTWFNSEDASECPKEFPFVMPVISKSTVPDFDTTTLSPSSPIVYQTKGAESVLVSVSQFTKVVVKKLPIAGKLKRNSNGNHVVLDEEVSSETKLRYEPDGGSWSMVLIELEVGNGGQRQEIHFWSLKKPTSSEVENSLTIQALEDRPQITRLNSFGRTASGEPLQIVVASLPTNGKLFQLESLTDRRMEEITAPNTTVKHFGGAVQFEPNAVPFVNAGGDAWTFNFESSVSGMRSEDFTIIYKALPVDDLPVAQDVGAELEEEQQDGVNITLNGTDVDGDVSYAVTSLPTKGKLYTEDGELID
eukprot:CAMPEP_0203747928 /NCGR_PEP_ID=MMETSP0098-20131031/2940_1 /ASSEMBLY_ACC=CAM_ASM_000208 /TAXON_ID=96639 /ORGANISM=" , Strain NY0313808BC1" /LENGTH=544 /DNA_ID=CAMNT_0050636513 /DNA_START=6724 /DNA_END=8355 /DNA_ORIENTATION=+